MRCARGVPWRQRQRVIERASNTAAVAGIMCRFESFNSVVCHVCVCRVGGSLCFPCPVYLFCFGIPVSVLLYKCGAPFLCLSFFSFRLSRCHCTSLFLRLCAVFCECVCLRPWALLVGLCVCMCVCVFLWLVSSPPSLSLHGWASPLFSSDVGFTCETRLEQVHAKAGRRGKQGGVVPVCVTEFQPL